MNIISKTCAGPNHILSCGTDGISRRWFCFALHRKRRLCTIQNKARRNSKICAMHWLKTVYFTRVYALSSAIYLCVHNCANICMRSCSIRSQTDNLVGMPDQRLGAIRSLRLPNVRAVHVYKRAYFPVHTRCLDACIQRERVITTTRALALSHNTQARVK
jgi:hypothetical protein